jgi:hypothetical protein
LHRGLALAAVGLCAMLTLAGCQASAPIGVQKNGDTLTVVIGYQCGSDPAGYLQSLRLQNYDRGKRMMIEPPLWEIQARAAHPVHRVDLGVVPDGYAATVDNIASEGVGATMELTVSVAGNQYTMAVDKDHLRDGNILDPDGNLISEAKFQKRFGCPR